MTRGGELSVLAASAFLAGLGTAMVDLATESTLTGRVVAVVAIFAAAMGALHWAVRVWIPRANPFLLPSVALLVAVGLVEVARIDPDLGAAQLRWLVVAAVVAVGTIWVLRRVGTDTFRRFRWSILLAGAILLALPLLPGDWPVGGVELNGARLWVKIDIGGLELVFQPGEVARLAVIIFLASYLADRYRSLREMHRRVGPLGLPEPRQLTPLALAWLASAGVLIFERDLGAALLLFGVFVAMLFAATGRGVYAAAGGVLAGGGGFVASAAFDHVGSRVDAWLHPFHDYLGSGFQVAQGLFALGSGSISGAGLGVGRPDLMPAAATDLIFAAIAEELGYFGSIAVLAVYALLVTAAFGIALRAADFNRKLLAVGIASGFAIQVFLIVGGIVRIVPLTGVTLPFISYGGSSLVASLASVAVLLVLSHEEAR